MCEPQVYERRPKEVRALKYEPNVPGNEEAILKWLGGAHVLAVHHQEGRVGRNGERQSRVIFQNNSDEEPKVLYPGQFLVLDEGEFRALSVWTFDHDYILKAAVKA